MAIPTITTISRAAYDEFLESLGLDPCQTLSVTLHPNGIVAQVTARDAAGRVIPVPYGSPTDIVHEVNGFISYD